MEPNQMLTTPNKRIRKKRAAPSTTSVGVQVSSSSLLGRKYNKVTPSSLQVTPSSGRVYSEPALQPSKQALEGGPGQPGKMDDSMGKGDAPASEPAAARPATGVSRSVSDSSDPQPQPTTEGFTMEPTSASTRYQYLFGVSAGFAAMTAGAWLGWPSSTIEYLSDSKTLVGGEVSTMVALMDFGNMLSPIPAGYLMDIVGRKPTLLGTAVVYLIASISVLAYENKWLIFIARVMAGLGKGIAFSVVPIYLAEIANVQVRGALSTMFIGFLNLGMFYGYLIGPFVSYTFLNVAVLAIPLSFLATFLFFPESPYFLLMKSREASARKSLTKYRKADKSDPEQMTDLEHELSEMTRRVERDMRNKGRFVDLISTRGNRKALLIIAALAFFQRSSGISPTLAYSTTIMPKTGGGTTPKVYMIIFSGLLIAANFLALPLVDRVGRKPLLLVSSISTGICTAVTGVFYQLQHSKSDVSSLNWIPYATLLLFSVTYSIGIGFLPSTLVGELMPTNVKSHAGAVSAIILAAVSFIVNKIFKEVNDKAGPAVMYFYFTFACFACAAFVQFLVFETKGKTFGEIQDILNGGHATTSDKTNGDVQLELRKDEV